MAPDAERPVVRDFFSLAELSSTRHMDMMSNFVKNNIGEQCVADGRDSHSSRTLSNDIVDKNLDISWLTLPRLVIAPQGFFTLSRLPSMLRFLSATRTVQASGVRHDDAAQPNKVLVRNARYNSRHCLSGVHWRLPILVCFYNFNDDNLRVPLTIILAQAFGNDSRRGYYGKHRR